MLLENLLKEVKKSEIILVLHFNMATPEENIIEKLESEQVDVQHLPHQHLITNPNAIKGSPKLLRQPQHALHAATVQVLPIKAKLNKYDPKTKQTKSQAPAK